MHYLRRSRRLSSGIPQTTLGGDECLCSACKDGACRLLTLSANSTRMCVASSSLSDSQGVRTIPEFAVSDRSSRVILRSRIAIASCKSHPPACHMVYLFSAPAWRAGLRSPFRESLERSTKHCILLEATGGHKKASQPPSSCGSTYRFVKRGSIAVHQSNSASLRFCNGRAQNPWNADVLASWTTSTWPAVKHNKATAGSSQTSHDHGQDRRCSASKRQHVQRAPHGHPRTMLGWSKPLELPPLRPLECAICALVVSLGHQCQYW